MTGRRLEGTTVLCRCPHSSQTKCAIATIMLHAICVAAGGVSVIHEMIADPLRCLDNQCVGISGVQISGILLYTGWLTI